MKKYYNEPVKTESGNLYQPRPAISREDVISQAIDNCLDLMYRASYPSITLEEYMAEHEKFETREEKENARLYESHYLPWKVYRAIEEDFIEAYDLKSPLPDIIEILKGYFKEPIVDKWIEGKEGEPGHKGYEKPEPMDDETYQKAEKFLDMANEFYNWNRDLNGFVFNISNYSPCSNRETVEQWWHEHGDPDFKLPEDSYWVDGWDDMDDDGWPSEEETEEEEDE